MAGLSGVRALEWELARTTAAARPPRAVADAVQLAAGGAYRAAAQALGDLVSDIRDSQDLLLAGWWRLAIDACWLALPDGSGRVQITLGDDYLRPLDGQSEWAAATGRAQPGRLTALALLVGTSVPESRAWLSMLPPCSRPSPLTAQVLQQAMATLTAARQLAQQVDARLIARVDLLAAELLRRGGDPQ